MSKYIHPDTGLIINIEEQTVIEEDHAFGETHRFTKEAGLFITDGGQEAYECHTGDNTKMNILTDQGSTWVEKYSPAIVIRYPH